MSQRLKEWAFEQNPSLLDWIRVDPDYIGWTESVQATTQELDMKMNEMFESQSNYMKASDFKGKAKKLIVDGVSLQEFTDNDGRDVKKPVVSFTSTDKELVMNKTNGQAIATMYGDDTDDWIGKEVILYPTTTDFGGNTVPCIRVQVQMPVDEEFDDSIPF